MGNVHPALPASLGEPGRQAKLATSSSLQPRCLEVLPPLVRALLRLGEAGKRLMSSKCITVHNPTQEAAAARLHEASLVLQFSRQKTVGPGPDSEHLTLHNGRVSPWSGGLCNSGAATSCLASSAMTSASRLRVQLEPRGLCQAAKTHAVRFRAETLDMAYARCRSDLGLPARSCSASLSFSSAAFF